ARPAASVVARTEGGAEVAPGPRCSGSHAASTTAPGSGAGVAAVGKPNASIEIGTTARGAALSGAYTKTSRPRAAGAEAAVWASDEAMGARARASPRPATAKGDLRMDRTT